MDRTAEESRAHLVAGRLAERGELKNSQGQAITQISEILHNSTANMDTAMKQAETELTSIGLQGDKNLQIRRALEIIDSKRNEDLVEESRQFGGISAFTGPPDGYVGVIASLVNKGIMASPFKIGDFQLLSVFVPFVNIVGNVANTGLNYTPMGAVRSLSDTRITVDKKTVKIDKNVSKRSILDSPDRKSTV